MAEQEPSKNPADAEGGLIGLLRVAILKAQQSQDGQLPGVVMSYDRASNTAQIQPSIVVVGTEGQILQRAPIASVPVLALAGGNFTLRFPVKAGDAGWIEASDRDISLYMQAAAKQITKPNSKRMHSFSDGRFVPDSFGKAVIASDNFERVVLQTLDGETYIAVGDDGVFVKGTKLEIDAPTTFKKPVEMLEGLTVDGIQFDSHGHDGVQSGPDISGGPVSI